MKTEEEIRCVIDVFEESLVRAKENMRDSESDMEHEEQRGVYTRIHCELNILKWVLEKE